MSKGTEQSPAEKKGGRNQRRHTEVSKTKTMGLVLAPVNLVLGFL